MQRDSDRHGPRKDDEMVGELRGTLQGNRPSRAEEWRDPEPPADDDPAPLLGDLSHAREPDSPSGYDLAPQHSDLSHARGPDSRSGDSHTDDDLASQVGDLSHARGPDSRSAE